MEDEGQLTNFKIREHFLTKLYALADWRQVRRKFSMSQLIEFHTAHKLPLMAYNQKQLRVLEKIAANEQGNSDETVSAEYDVNFKRAFHLAPRAGSNINVLMHALGYFSDELTTGEKRYFLGALEKYRAGKAPLSAPLNVLHSWIVRFDRQYLAGQFYFEPYPEELTEITDSGKGRDY